MSSENFVDFAYRTDLSDGALASSRSTTTPSTNRATSRADDRAPSLTRAGFEAGINRLPIVCTGLPVFRDLAGDAALYVRADDDPARIATRLLRLVDADRRGRLARDVRAKCAWEAVFRERIAPLLAPG